MNIYTHEELNQYLNIAHSEFNKHQLVKSNIKKLKFQELICQSYGFNSKNHLLSTMKKQPIVIISVLTTNTKITNSFFNKVFQTYKIKFDDFNYFERVSNIFLKQLLNSPQKNFVSSILKKNIDGNYSFDNIYAEHYFNDKALYGNEPEYFEYKKEEKKISQEENIQFIIKKHSLLIDDYSCDPYAITSYLTELIPYLILSNHDELRRFYPLAKYIAQYWITYFEETISEEPLDNSLMHIFHVMRHISYQLNDLEYNSFIHSKIDLINKLNKEHYI